jgi:hypothetical protein
MMTSSGVLDVTVPYQFGKHGLRSEEKKMGHGQKVQHLRVESFKFMPLPLG